MADGKIGLIIMKDKAVDPKLTLCRQGALIYAATPISGAHLTAEQARAVRLALSRYIREIEAGEP